MFEASVTAHSLGIAVRFADDALTKISGAHLQIEILVSLMPLMNLFRPLLNLIGKLLEEGNLGVVRVVTERKGQVTTWNCLIL